MRNLLKRPKHSTAVAYLALFVALAGGAYAAATVNSGDVVNNSLKSVDLKNNKGVKGVDVRNSSLRGNDIANDSVTGNDVNEASLLAARIVARLGGAPATPLSNVPAQSAIPNPTYTQAGDSLDQFFGDAKVTFPAACTSPRQAIVYLLRNYTPPIGTEDVVAVAQFSDSGAGAVTKTMAFGAGFPGLPGNYSMPNGSPQPSTFSVYAQGQCNAGSGITLDEVRVHILGAR
jgi:hypothetical protein